MSNQSMEKQIDVTLKALLTFMTEPRMKADAVAKMLGVSPNYIARLLMKYRDAGVDIRYDFKNEKYVGKFNEQLSDSVLGSFAKKLRTTVSKAAFSKPPVEFVTSLDRYTVPEFSQFIGTTTANVYNALNAYKGQSLPTGWVAYQNQGSGRWNIVRARTDRSGKHFEVPPEIVSSAHRYVLGAGEILKGKAKTGLCAYPDCTEGAAVKALCRAHYFKARRHPERFVGIIRE